MNRYIVFLKQVPLSTKIKIDRVTKTLQRSSGASRTNPDDLYALEAALWLRSKTGGEVVAVSMGPSSAEVVLREAIQRGADRAVLVSDIAFAGSDTWCTSLVLAATVRKIGDYKALLFGRMAIDGDTAQVGPEVAAQLLIPQVTSLNAIDYVDSKCVEVTRGTQLKQQRLVVQFPCAIMVSKRWGHLPAPTLRGWRLAKDKSIEHFSANDLGISVDEVGLLASPTRVVETNVPLHNKEIVWLNSVQNVSELISTFIRN